MLFQLVLTKFFKSELFSCLPKVDHVIKSCKEPISRPQSSSPLHMTNFVLRVFWLSNPGDEVGSDDKIAHLQNSLAASPRFHRWPKRN